MTSFLKITVVAVIFQTMFIFSGCTGVQHSYLNPAFPVVTKSDLRPVGHPPAVKLAIHWQTFGQPKDSVPQGVPALVASYLRSTNCFASVDSGNDGSAQLDITINNYGDIGEAIGGGILVGATFGAAGASVTDQYSFRVVYRAPGHDEVKFEYEHNLTRTDGMTNPPKHLVEAPSNGEAFPLMIEQFVYRLVKDMQEKGELQ